LASGPARSPQPPPLSLHVALPIWEQPSPPTRSPSSQRSPSSTRPFPQDDADSGSEGAFRRARRSARTREPEPLERTQRMARKKRTAIEGPAQPMQIDPGFHPEIRYRERTIRIERYLDQLAN